MRAKQGRFDQKDHVMRRRAGGVNLAFKRDLTKPESVFPSADDDLRHALDAELSRRRKLLGLTSPLYASISKVSKVLHMPASGPYTVTGYVTSARLEPLRERSEGASVSVFTYVVDIDPDVQMGDVSGEPYVCPNCGAASTISELEYGCSFCGTRYETSDLFPRVFGYHVTRDLRAKHLRRLSLAGVALPFLALLVANPVSSLFGVPVAISLVIASLVILIAAHTAARRLHLRGVRDVDRFADDVSGVANGYSFEFFEADVVSALKRALFAKKLGACPCFNCEGSFAFDDIVAADYLGTGRYGGMALRGGTCVFSLELAFRLTRLSNGKLAESDETFAVDVEHVPEGLYNPAHTFHAVKCNNCSGSFDPLATSICPYCGSGYDPRLQTWVITRCKRIPSVAD